MAYPFKNARHYFTISALVPTQAEEPIEIGGGLTFTSAPDRAAFAAELAVSGGLAGVGSIGTLTGVVLLSDLFEVDSETNTLTLVAALGELAEGQVHASTLTVSGKAISLSGDFATVGAYGLTLNVSGTTEVTLPTSGTLATQAYVTSAIAGFLGGVQYQGAWNASTDSPVLPGTPDSSTKGHYYVVSVAGTSNKGGILDWQVGDWIISNGASWSKVDNTELPLTTTRTASFLSSSQHGTLDLLNTGTGTPVASLPQLASSNIPNGFTKTFARTGGVPWLLRPASGETIDGSGLDLLIDGVRESVAVAKTGSSVWTVVHRKRGPKWISNLADGGMDVADIRAGDIVFGRNGVPNAQEDVLGQALGDGPTEPESLGVWARMKPAEYGYPLSNSGWYGENGGVVKVDVARWMGGSWSGFIQINETHVASGYPAYYNGGAYLFYVAVDNFAGGVNGGGPRFVFVVQLAGSSPSQTGRLSWDGTCIQYTPQWDPQDDDGQVVMCVMPIVTPEF